MAERLLAGADRLALGAAGVITRRRLFRNAGAGALGLAIVTSFGGLRPGRALAHGTSSHPCGPSPIASSGYCPGGNCGPPAACTRRRYNYYTCSSSTANCWPEDYRNVGRGRWRCCDICANNGTGTRCSGSCGSYGHRAAICRTRTG
jgi:hypothetical protein